MPNKCNYILIYTKDLKLKRKEVQTTTYFDVLCLNEIWTTCFNAYDTGGSAYHTLLVVLFTYYTAWLRSGLNKSLNIIIYNSRS